MGAGIAGLSAALEAGRGGATVLVVDLASVFGGHAVMAQGLLNIVATPAQAALGIQDSSELAQRDFRAWGEDADETWVKYYTEHSGTDVFAWLEGLGVRFEGVGRPPGNTVARAHNVRGRGIALVAAIYRECLETPAIAFRWNVQLEALTRRAAGVGGVRIRELRTGRQVTIEARTAVILATGGFQSNLELVRAAWSRDLPPPGRLLAGGGINARGSALSVAREVGATTERLDHQWNYLSGLPDPRFPGTDRGVLVFVPSIWVNAEGRRFMPENVSPRDGMRPLLLQPGGTFWSVFGEESLTAFYVSGSDWADYRRIEELIINNPALVKRGDTLEELCAKTGLPVEPLRATLARANTGSDEEFAGASPGGRTRRFPVSGPPYFALQCFPLARKSLGGVAIDGSCRVLNAHHEPIAGLFAVGEVAGFGGINGKAGLEGTFLGPALAQGRVAARTVLAAMGRRPGPPITGRQGVVFREEDRLLAPAVTCLSCHPLAEQVRQERPGYWHFAKVHQAVLAQQFSCQNCHAEIPDTTREPPHRPMDPKLAMLTCGLCHQGESR